MNTPGGIKGYVTHYLACYEHTRGIKGYVTYYLACYEHTRGMKGYVTYYLACYVRLQVQNMPGCHLRKYGFGQMGRLEEKIAAALLY
jgi:hypothetical protein